MKRIFMKKRVLLPTIQILLVCSACGSSYSASNIATAANAEFRNYDFDKKGNYLDFKNKVINFSSTFSDKYNSFYTDENKIFSPLSVFLCLGMLSQCTANDSSQEILDFFDIDNSLLVENYKYLFELQNKYKLGNNQKVITEETTNSIWIENNFEYKKDALINLANNFYADSFHMDFINNPLNSAKIIQDYIKDKTRGLIDISLEQYISDLTRLVILNTLYMKDLWNEEGFDLNETKDLKEFVNSDGSHKNTKLNISYYFHGKPISTEKYSTFHVFSDANFELRFIVPQEGYKATDMLRKDILSEIHSIKDFTPTENEGKIVNKTKVYFPSFESSSNVDLKEMFKQTTNVKSIFDPLVSDFSAISAKEDLVCSALVHAAKLKVNRKGMEGAAITVAIGDATSPGPNDEIEYRYFDFFVNKAFAYELLDSNGYPLFVGTVDKLN